MQVRSTKLPPRLPLGSTMPVAEIDKLGIDIGAGSLPGTLSYELSTVGPTYFVPLSLNGEIATIGASAQVVLIADIASLEVQVNKKEIRMHWPWPDGAERCLVCVGEEAMPVAPTAGPTVSVVPVTKAEYDRAGVVLRQATERTYYLAVFAETPGAPGVYGRPATAVAVVGEQVRVFYDVRVARGGPRWAAATSGRSGWS